MGGIFLFYYYSFVLRIAIKAGNRWLTLALFMLSISDLHYTSSFYYPSVPLLMAFLAIRVYLTNESYSFTMKTILGAGSSILNKLYKREKRERASIGLKEVC